MFAVLPLVTFLLVDITPVHCYWTIPRILLVALATQRKRWHSLYYRTPSELVFRLIDSLENPPPLDCIDFYKNSLLAKLLLFLLNCPENNLLFPFLGRGGFLIEYIMSFIFSSLLCSPSQSTYFPITTQPLEIELPLLTPL
jgi:hypothetical protein